MGDVIVVFRIIPSDMEKFEDVRKSLEHLKPQRLTEEPVAFGLKALIFTKIVPDEEGGMTNLEDKLTKVPGVQTCETITISRSL
jgi:elongation factor 1-beta